MYKYDPQVRAEEEGVYTTYNPLCTIIDKDDHCRCNPYETSEAIHELHTRDMGLGKTLSLRLSRDHNLCPSGCPFGCQEAWALGKPCVDDSNEAFVQT